MSNNYVYVVTETAVNAFSDGSVYSSVKRVFNDMQEAINFCFFMHEKFKNDTTYSFSKTEIV